jgi:DNA polymerase-3 subunit beta
MKITIDQKELKSKLRIIQGLSSDKGMAILDHFILSSNGRNEIIATDLTTSVREGFEAISINENGTISIPRKKLYEIVNQLEGNVTLESMDNNYVVVQSGKSRFKLAGISPDDYPAFPEIKAEASVVVESEKMVEMLERTLPCVADTGDTRYTLNCILFHFKPSESMLNLISTNGHKLAFVSTPVEMDSDKDSRLLVPKSSASRLKQFLSSEPEDSKVLIEIAENHVRFKATEKEIAIRLAEGTYPDYEQVLQGVDSDKIIVIRKDEMIAAAKRALIVSRDGTSVVNLKLKKNALVLSSKTAEGASKNEITVDYIGKDFSIAFNGRYLLEASAMCRNDIVLKMKEPLSVSEIQESGNTNFRFILMPMRG